MAKTAYIKEAEAVVKAARIDEKTAQDNLSAAHSKANAELYERLGRLHSDYIHEICKSFSRQPGEGPCALTPAQLKALDAIGNGYSHLATFSSEDLQVLQELVDKSPIGLTHPPLPSLAEIRAAGSAYAEAGQKHTAAAGALKAAKDELYIRQMEELGFPGTRTGSAKPDVDKIVRTSSAGGKWDFWAVSKTGGRMKVRTGTRPYTFCTLSADLYGGTFTTGDRVQRVGYGSGRHDYTYEYGITEG